MTLEEKEEREREEKQAVPIHRRSKAETALDILRAIGSERAKPTHILYRANLSWTVLQSYLVRLTEKGLVEKHVDRFYHVTYSLTQEGLEVLQLSPSLFEKLS